jgi:integrase
MILVRWKVRYQVTRQAVAKSVGGRVGEDVTLYDLRHFHASGLPARGGHVVTVQRALGHAKATTTLNAYAHLRPTAEDRTRSAAGDLLTACGLAAASVTAASL